MDIVRAFVGVHDLEVDEMPDNAEVYRELGELDMLGITIPEQYGGAGCPSIEAHV